MANSGPDFTDSSKGHAKHERPKMSFYVELRAYQTGQNLPDHARAGKNLPRGRFNDGSLM
jgi:hypothetical protein